MNELRHLDLFSGYGGFHLGLKLAGLNIRTIGWCDNDKYVQKIIKARIEDGLISDAPIISNIRSFNWELYRGLVDIITAGFPCQPHSHAGKRAGKDDDRNLWPDTLGVIREVQPRYALLENVPGLLSSTGTSEVESTGSDLGDATTGTPGYAATVIGQLSEIGFRCEWKIISASDVGAPHLRQRWWCFAWLEGDTPRSNTNGIGPYNEEVNIIRDSELRDKQISLS